MKYVCSRDSEDRLINCMELVVNKKWVCRHVLTLLCGFRGRFSYHLVDHLLQFVVADVVLPPLRR